MDFTGPFAGLDCAHLTDLWLRCQTPKCGQTFRNVAAGAGVAGGALVGGRSGRRGAVLQQGGGCRLGRWWGGGRQTQHTRKHKHTAAGKNSCALPLIPDDGIGFTVGSRPVECERG